MRTNVLSFFSSGSIPVFLTNVWDRIDSKLGLTLNIENYYKRSNGSVLTQESLFPFSKATSKNLSNNPQPGSFVPCFHNTDM